MPKAARNTFAATSRIMPAGLLIATLALLSPATAQTTPQPAIQSDAAVATAIDAALAPHFKPNEPGATVIVTRDGKPVFRKAYGMANIEHGIALKPEMSLRLGSITKQFTAVGILMLADQGKLAVSDDIRKFLPDYPTQGRTVTIEHLLTHTSGIKSYTDMASYRQGMRTDMTVQAVIDLFKNEPFAFEPGERYAYNNSGYFLLGAIIEKVSGMSYADFMAKHIFEPLGMKNTAYDSNELIIPNRANGYSRREGKVRNTAYLSLSQPYAAGALLSSVDDLMLWDAAITSGKLLKPDTWKQAFTPYKPKTGEAPGYGYGWFMRSIQGQPAIEHGGAINGFNTYAVRLPQDKVYVALLSNEDSASRAYIGEKIAAIAIGKPYADWKAVKLDDSVLDRYIGIYKIDDKTTRVVTRTGNQLFSQRTGGRKIAMQPSSETEFFLVNSFSHLKFVKDSKGEVTQMVMVQGGKEETSPRISAKPPAEREAIKIAHTVFDAYVGAYQLAPDFILSVTRDGDRYLSQATGQGKAEIFPESETRFFLKVVDAQLQFVKDGEGKVNQLILFQNGREMPAKRIK